MRNNTPAKQSGAALIVSLVLLMVLTVLAISTMRTATLETAMAGNAQYRQMAFETAQAGISDVMESIDDGTYDLALRPDVGPVLVLEQSTGTEAGNYTVTVESIGRSVATGYSAGIALDENYELEATGLSARNAKSIQRQGIKRLVLVD